LSWKQQYEQRNYDVLKRFNTVVLRGPTQLGKTSYAESIFSEVAMLTVQCQGLDKDLPSLREFCGDTHKCTVQVALHGCGSEPLETHALRNV
jgi:hypothetical protein